VKKILQPASLVAAFHGKFEGAAEGTPFSPMQRASKMDIPSHRRS